MKAALQTLAALTVPQGGRKVAILGEMLELGDLTPQFHAELAPSIQKAGIGLLCTVGKAMRALEGKTELTMEHQHFDNAAAAQVFLDQLQVNDVVLCKGSHGSGVYRLVEAIKTKTHSREPMVNAV